MGVNAANPLLAVSTPSPVFGRVRRASPPVSLSPVVPLMDRARENAVAHASLIRAVAVEADRTAFRALFEYFAPRIKTWMIRHGVPEEGADELAQETLMVLWRKAAQFDPARAGPSTWIFTIARNLRIDRQRRDRHPGELMPVPEDIPDDAPHPDTALDTARRESRLRRAMGILSPEQAEVVRLAFFQDKPHAEIERLLGIPLGTVKSRLRLAMQRLRTALEDLSP